MPPKIKICVFKTLEAPDRGLVGRPMFGFVTSNMLNATGPARLGPSPTEPQAPREMPRGWSLGCKGRVARVQNRGRVPCPHKTHGDQNTQAWQAQCVWRAHIWHRSHPGDSRRMPCFAVICRPSKRPAKACPSISPYGKEGSAPRPGVGGGPGGGHLGHPKGGRSLARSQAFGGGPGGGHLGHPKGGRGLHVVKHSEAGQARGILGLAGRGPSPRLRQRAGNGVGRAEIGAARPRPRSKRLSICGRAARP